jgi:crotonobetaine/carnitine-CoA ligase
MTSWRRVEPRQAASAATVKRGRPVRPARRAAADVDPDDVAVIPTSGTTGGSARHADPRAYVMAGEGFPFWLGLTSDDRLTSLPLFHINAPAYSTLGSVAAKPAGAPAGLLSQSFLDAARRYRATEFNAIGAMLEILMRQPERPDDADTPLRLCYTGPSPERERQEAIERRFGLEIVCGYALSESPYGLIWPRGSRPFGTLGAARQHPSWGVSDARVPSRMPAAWASSSCATRRSRGYHGMPDGRGPYWSTAGCARATSCAQRRRHLHLRRPPQGGDPPPRREPVTG